MLWDHFAWKLNEGCLQFTGESIAINSASKN